MTRIRFLPEFCSEPHFVRDLETGLLWYYDLYRVLYADTDAAGIVYHGTYFRFFEQARGALLRHHCISYHEIEQSGTFSPVVDVSAAYYKPIEYDDVLALCIRPKELTRATLSFDYRIIHQSKKILTTVATTRHATVNKNKVLIPVHQELVHLCATFGVYRDV